uniref:Uncharacterized protein n=1 Tax=Talaromyces marneffei PM1 TaxID=1077442 RepID=A0A093VWP7_TALMA
MDSPAVLVPLDPREQPILDRLLRTRDALLLLKQDKSSYIKSRDVLPLYEEVIGQVETLNAVRKSQERDRRMPHTRLDYVLDDCFQLISLLFLTVGRNNEAPATLRKGLEPLSPELVKFHETLVSILRSTSAANTRSKFSSSEVSELQERLKEIQNNMKDGNFVGSDGQILGGQEAVKSLYERCWRWTEIVLERYTDPTSYSFKAKAKIPTEKAWSLRETDLFHFQRKLDRIDEARVNGNFLDATNQPADLHAQRTLLYLIRRSYAYIYALLIASEPVSEALLPIYNQLQTLRRCLLEVKDSGGVSNSRELYPYSMKLNSIDNMRIDGKFYIGNDIPEGQGSVNSLLAECYELAYDLRAAVVDEDKEDRGEE